MVHRLSGLIVIAHRGASAYAPESTEAAIRLALAQHADMVELDVQLTRDRRLAIFHDERLERTSSGRGVLSERTYHELARLDCGSWFASRFTGERILLASQALRLVPPPRLVNLELKPTTHVAILIDRLFRCLRWTRTMTRVLVSSFDASLLARLRAAQPTVARALLCTRRAAVALRQAARLGCLAVHPHKSLVDQALLVKAHAAHLRVHVWTVDHMEEAERLIRWGVDGIVTNRPDRLRAACHRWNWKTTQP